MIATGNYMIVSGNHMIASGNQMIASGNYMIASGNHMIASGNHLDEIPQCFWEQGEVPPEISPLFLDKQLDVDHFE